MTEKYRGKEEILAALLREGGIEPEGPVPIERHEGLSEAPLSFAQERFWFLNQLEGGAHYNDHLALRLKGELDESAFEWSLKEIVRRHECLRTTFHSVEGVPVQRIGPYEAIRIDRFDLGDVADGRRETEALMRASKYLAEPFKLDRSPAYRLALWKLGPDDHLFVLCINQIINDGWSLRVLTGELVEFYRSFVKGEPAGLQEPRIQYADFAIWQRENLDSTALSPAMEYWKKQLSGGPSTLELPTDLPRIAGKSFRGARYHVSFPETLLNSLRDLGQMEEATLFMVLLAAFKTLIYRYTGEDDIAIGFPSANRDRAETEDLLGVFINPLVLKSDLSDEPTFRELLARVRKTAVDAYANQQLPFEKLVEELHPERDAEHPPLFQVLFDYNNVPMPDLDLPGLSVSRVQLDAGTAKFDLSFELTESATELSGFFEYRTDLFSEEFIRRMAVHFNTLLEEIAVNPESRVSSIRMMTEAELEKALVEWNSTEKPLTGPLLIHKAFEQQARVTPDRTAVLFEDRSKTFSELNSEANRIAAFFISLGLGNGCRIGVSIDRSDSLVACLLGILKAGCAFVPLDPQYPAERVRYMAEDASISLLVTEEKYSGLLPEEICPVYLIDRGPLVSGAPPETDPDVQIPDEAPAYLIYTSGSTGSPKGVYALHRGAMNRFSWMWDKYEFGPDELCCQKASLNFADSIWEIFGPMLKGIPVLIAPDAVVRDPDAFIDLISEKRISRIVVVPSYLEAILRFGDSVGERLRHLRYCVSSGEALSADLARRFMTLLPNAVLLNLYGSSEVSADSTFYEVTSEELAREQTVPIGRPIDNTQAYVFDKRGRPVPVAIPGEVFIGGEGLSPGYHERPELNERHFLENPFRKGERLFRTGDLGAYRSDGNITYLGRVDDQVKVRGMRVEPGEIESALRAFEWVREAVVVLRRVSGENEVLVAYIVTDGGDDRRGELETFLRARLPDHMIPGFVQRVDELPRTQSGKINRRALRQQEKFRPVPASRSLAPKNDTEARMLEIWRRLLGVESIGVTDNFFDVGGHSLLAVKLFHEIEVCFGRKLPIASLFRAPTAEGLAGLLRREHEAADESSLVPIQPEGDRPPFFCVHAAGGNVLFYRDLARRLGENQPFYGLQARRIGGRQVAHDDLREMAAFYIEAIREIQPHGPYFLGGASFGGLAAYEMAQQLTAAGEEVAFLALLDTRAPGYPVMLPGTTLLKRRFLGLVQRARHHVDDLRLLESGTRWDYLAGKAAKLRHRLWRLQRKYKDVLRDEGIDPAARTFFDQVLGRNRLRPYEAPGTLPDDYRKTEGNIRRAYDGYEPQPYRGPVTLFRATNQMPGIVPDTSLGWDRYVGELESFEVRGYHGSIVAEPHVQFLTGPLKTALGRARERCVKKSKSADA